MFRRSDHYGYSMEVNRLDNGLLTKGCGGEGGGGNLEGIYLVCACHGPIEKDEFAQPSIVVNGDPAQPPQMYATSCEKLSEINRIARRSDRYAESRILDVNSWGSYCP